MSAETCKEAGKHLRPIHFNRKEGHVWICLECRTKISGPNLPFYEVEALVVLGEIFTADIKDRKSK